MIQETLARTCGHRQKAAEHLGISRRTLSRKLKDVRHRLSRRRPGHPDTSWPIKRPKIGNAPASGWPGLPVARGPAPAHFFRPASGCQRRGIPGCPRVPGAPGRRLPSSRTRRRPARLAWHGTGSWQCGRNRSFVLSKTTKPDAAPPRREARNNADAGWRPHLYRRHVRSRTVLAHSGIDDMGTATEALRFLILLLLGVLCSTLKVSLPGTTSTLSVNYIFVLIAASVCDFPQALIVAAACFIAQSFLRAKVRPNWIHVVFNTSSSSAAGQRLLCRL